MTAELWTQPIESLAPAIRAGRLSPVELAQSCLERIARVDDKLKSFTCLAPDVLKQAHKADVEIRSGNWRGPLHGIPIAVKDNYLTADMPSTAGTSAPGIAFPLRDSAAVARLRRAGAIVIGKTCMHEFAWGNVTPPVLNPWDLERVPSGSSGGSGAAVAAGLCAAALGSDTGGSIRMPASACGVVGLKPTFGRISRDGIVPHSWSLDHAGPLTRTVTDAAHLLAALAGYDPADPACQDRAVPDYSKGLGKPIKGLRIGVCRNYFFERNQPEIQQAVETAIHDLAALGARVVDFKLPNLDYGLAAIFAIELASSTAYHDQSLLAGRVQHYAPDVRTLVEMGRLVSAPDYLKAEQLRSVLMEDFRHALEKVDVIVGPTTPITAWKVGTWHVRVGNKKESVLAASWRFTFPYNLTGMPAVSIPCGFDSLGLPIGLQIAARPFDEAVVLHVAHAYEQAHDWKDRRPPL
ncbi:MAG: Asp-tRNA(Asn)/Glu-tRNA(Gln) amidotransferase subunit GatA [Candidatus Binataceae bacterium]|nr:Asp-tRNA(Asn)/Glu-tRNA(Gln) amidotransferase subunit GatA [Candidatus Binataceae bacterium]